MTGAIPATDTAAAAATAAPAVAERVGPAGMPARLRAADAAGLPPPPYAPLVGSEVGSFAHATITARLPAILESMIRDVEAEVAARAATAAGGWDEAAAAQAAAGLEELRRLRVAMLEDAPLEPLHVPGASTETQILLDSANACVQLAASRQQPPPQQQPAPRPSWLSLPWLVVECYMYTAIHAALQRQPVLAGLDPFIRQKAAAWAKSAAAAADMAAEVELLRQALHADELAPSTSAPATPEAAAAAAAAAQAAALAGLSMALWGNKADLSLLVNAAGLDTVALAAAAAPPPPSASLDQADGGGGGPAAAAAPTPSRVIVDESAAVWSVMEALRSRRAAAASGSDCGCEGVRMDVVLDNSGLELFADLCLADLMMSAGVADSVVLHGKPIPWFVSDTLSTDLEALLASCEAAEPPLPGVSAVAWQPVRRAAGRWRAHLAAGRWRWAAHPFWCTPAPFCWMAAAAPDLYGSLAGSDLLVLKGDLNYRKLAHDCMWPHTTPFQVALQGFHPAPLVALRTLKADVVAGLAEGQSEQLSAEDEEWLVNGKWGMVQAAL